MYVCIMNMYVCIMNMSIWRVSKIYVNRKNKRQNEGTVNIQSSCIRCSLYHLYCKEITK